MSITLWDCVKAELKELSVEYCHLCFVFWCCFSYFTDCKQLLHRLLTIDVKVDLLSWVILGVNNDFEAPLHTASTQLLCHLTSFTIGELAFDGDFLRTGTTGTVFVNIAYSDDTADDFFAYGNFIHNRQCFFKGFCWFDNALWFLLWRV